MTFNNSVITVMVAALMVSITLRHVIEVHRVKNVTVVFFIFFSPYIIWACSNHSIAQPVLP